MKTVGPYVILKKQEFPFIDEIHRLIKERPEYAQGIKEGIVSLRFLAGYSPFPKHRKAESVSEL